MPAHRAERRIDQQPGVGVDSGVDDRAVEAPVAVAVGIVGAYVVQVVAPDVGDAGMIGGEAEAEMAVALPQRPLVPPFAARRILGADPAQRHPQLGGAVVVGDPRPAARDHQPHVVARRHRSRLLVDDLLLQRSEGDLQAGLGIVELAVLVEDPQRGLMFAQPRVGPVEAHVRIGRQKAAVAFGVEAIGQVATFRVAAAPAVEHHLRARRRLLRNRRELGDRRLAAAALHGDLHLGRVLPALIVEHGYARAVQTAGGVGVLHRRGGARQVGEGITIEVPGVLHDLTVAVRGARRVEADAQRGVTARWISAEHRNRIGVPAGGAEADHVRGGAGAALVIQRPHPAEAGRRRAGEGKNEAAPLAGAERGVCQLHRAQRRRATPVLAGVALGIVRG